MQTATAMPITQQKTQELQKSHNLSRPTSGWTTIRATVVKELRIATRYVPNLIGSLVSMGLRMVFFMLLSGAISVEDAGSGGGSLAGRDLFIFFQGALILMVFNGPTLWGPIHAVTNDLYNGTLEFLYSTPVSRYAYYVGTVMAKVLINMILFLPLYVFIVIYSQVDIANMLMILLACGTVLVALTAMGIMVALLALLWRQVGSITEILGILFEMLAGAYLPIHAFPKIVQYVAYLMPHTWGYDLVRYYSFQGEWQTILPVWQEWGIMVVYAIVFTLLSRYLLGKAETLAKKQGLSVI
jgi:ABC-2 type transport system permease protein